MVRRFACRMLSKSLMCLKVKGGLAAAIAEMCDIQIRVLFSAHNCFVSVLSSVFNCLLRLTDCSYCVSSLLCLLSLLSFIVVITVFDIAWSPRGKRRLGCLALWVKWLSDLPPPARE